MLQGSSPFPGRCPLQLPSSVVRRDFASAAVWRGRSRSHALTCSAEQEKLRSCHVNPSADRLGWWDGNYRHNLPGWERLTRPSVISIAAAASHRCYPQVGEKDIAGTRSWRIFNARVEQQPETGQLCSDRSNGPELLNNLTSRESEECLDWTPFPPEAVWCR
jgi:hypothetical protein